MKTKAKWLFMTVIICLILLLITTVFSALMCTNAVSVAFAAEENNLEKLTKAYTDSDMLYGMGDTIQNYPSRLFASKVDAPGSLVDILGDDPIVNIIPRQYFIDRGDHIYIGKEYGFFVRTKQQRANSLNNSAVVLVFDISTDNNFKITKNRLKIRVEPLFQYEFVYLSPGDMAIEVMDEIILCENLSADGNIIPMPNMFLEFEPCTKFYLKDISFGATLYNEQDLNSIDTNYNPEKDDGSFITMYDYCYEGLLHDEKGFKDSKDDLDGSIASFMLGLTSFGLGFASKIPIPPINKLCGALSNVLNIASLGFGIGDIVNKNNTLLPINVAATSGKMTATCNYTTRRDQLDNYVDEQTRKPALAKSATILVKEKNNSPNLWYGNENFAEGYFTLSDSAPTNPWLTRYIQEIALKVVDKDGNEVAQQGYGSNTYMLHNPRYKAVEMGQQQTAVFLPEGYNYFKFKPQYTSDYKITFDKQYDFTMRISEAKSTATQIVSPHNGTVTQKFYAGKEYNIDIYSPLGDIVKFNIEPTAAISTHSIAKNDNYVVKYTSDKNQLVTFASSQQNVLISGIYQKTDTGMTSAPGVEGMKACASIECCMQANETYYIVLNNPNSIALSTKLTVKPLTRSLTLGENASQYIEGNSNYKYYKFVPTSNGIYSVSFGNDRAVNDYIMSFYCGGLGASLSYKFYNDGYVILYGLKANQEYFIAVASDKTINVVPNVTKDEQKMVWKYLENGSWIEVTDGNNIYLKRGHTYEFELWINDMLAQSYDMIIAQPVESDFTRVAGKRCGVTIGSKAVDYTSIAIQAKSPEHEGYNYDNELNVIAILDEAEIKAKSANVNYANETSITFNFPTDIVRWRATLRGKREDGTNFAWDLGIKTVPEYDVYWLLKHYNAIGDCTLKITSVYVRSVSDMIDGREVVISNYSLTIGATAFRKNNDNFYYIGNALQLYNIRHDQSHDRIIANNINLAEDYPKWTTIPTLTCNIDGRGHTIENLSMPIEGNQYPAERLGFVGTNKAQIYNLIFKNCAFSFGYEEKSNWTYVGAFAGVNEGNIQLCKAFGKVLGYRDLQSVGGIAGSNKGSILNCEFGSLKSSIGRSEVLSWGDIGGIAGQNYGTISDSRTLNTDVNQRLYGTSRSAGGIVGYGGAGSSIIRCSVEQSRIANINDSTIKSLYPKMGYIVGHMTNGTITSVGTSNVSKSTGSLYKKNVGYCFAVGWGFCGLLENCTIDGNPGQSGP